MQTERKYPIGIQSFDSLRKGGYLYVDKTEIIHSLISTGKYYFLSRPRRFGKSLLLSTIDAFFSGKKELFDGTIGPKLAIASKPDVSWQKHPVLHMDLNTEEYRTPESLISVLNENLVEWESIYGRNEMEIGLGRRFQGVIRRASSQYGHNVVILVDEYDKPLLQAIGNPELQEHFQSTLKGFYGALKSMDEHIEFAMVTGVTKFGKISVFSDLNNFNDISINSNYWNICGLSKDELIMNFEPEISQLARTNGIIYDDCVDILRQYYDGYHFHHTSLGVYNPFSVLCTFYNNEFGNYWFETATPTYLVTLLKDCDYNLEKISEVEISPDDLSSIDSVNRNPIPVLYQSGYLTIKDYDNKFKTYTLRFPNREVEEGFLNFLLPFYSSIPKSEAAFSIKRFVKDVQTGKTEQFIDRLKSFFADTPYELVKDLENHYQNVLWIVCKLAGLFVQAEYHTSNGRIDMVLQTLDYCYVMEFKLDGTAEDALKQISDKGYVLPFKTGGRKIIRIGLNFSSKTRNIDQYLID